MKKNQEEWNQEIELNDFDLEQIADHVKQGYSSGHLSDEEKKIYWEINIRSWKDK